MDKIAIEFLKDKLNSLTDTDFQKAINDIYPLLYPGNFQEIKQKRDKGCDGILNGNTIIAAYAPENYNLDDFRKKTTSDYVKYEQNWKQSFPKWNVVTNHPATGSMILHVKNLHNDSILTSVTELVAEIKNASWNTVIKIFRSLQIPERYYTNDLFTYILEDIISMQSNGNLPSYEKPIFISDKIEINIEDSYSQKLFLEEYEDQIEYFSTIKDVLARFSDEQVLAIRSKIQMQFNSFNGNFIQKLQLLTSALSSNKNDDIYQAYVRRITLYFFEQCLFGLKSKLEK